jgi:hypothetical protein
MEEESRIRGQLEFLKKRGWQVEFADRAKLDSEMNKLSRADVILFGREHNTWNSSNLDKYIDIIRNLAVQGKIIIVDSMRNPQNRWLLSAEPFKHLNKVFDSKKSLAVRTKGKNESFWLFPNSIKNNRLKRIQAPIEVSGLEIYGNGRQKPFSLAISKEGKGCVILCPAFIDAKLIENIYVWKVMKNRQLGELGYFKLPDMYYGKNELSIYIMKTPVHNYSLNISCYTGKNEFANKKTIVREQGKLSIPINVPVRGVDKIKVNIAVGKDDIYSYFERINSRPLFYAYAEKGQFEFEPLHFTTIIKATKNIFPAVVKWKLKSSANGTILDSGECNIVSSVQKIEIPVKKDLLGEMVWEAGLYKESTKLAEHSVRVETVEPPAKRNIVSFRPDNTMLINGKSFFPIWGSRVSNAQLPAMERVGFNSITDMKDFAQLGSSKFRRDGVNQAANYVSEFDMKKFAMLNWEFWNKYGRKGNGEFGEGLRKEIPLYRNNSAIIANYLMDEPPVHLLSKVAKGYKLIKKLDPYHPVAVCVMHMDKESVQKAVKKAGRFCDILMVDPYPVPYRSMDEVWKQIDGARKAYNDKVPVMSWIQAFSYSTDRNNHALGRFPTKKELRCQTYLSLTHGVRGIGFFCMNWLSIGRLDVNRRAFWNALCNVVAEVKELTPMLVSKNKIIGGKTTGMSLHWFMSLVDSKAYLIVVNSSRKSLNVSIEVPGLTLPFDEYFESRLMYPKNCTFSDKFSSYGVHVYMFSGIKKLVRPNFFQQKKGI